MALRLSSGEASTELPIEGSVERAGQKRHTTDANQLVRERAPPLIPAETCALRKSGEVLAQSEMSIWRSPGTAPSASPSPPLGGEVSLRVMKLYGSMTSPFVRKVRVVIQEMAIPCDFIRDNPRLPHSHTRELSPLGKVPLLELDDGTVVFDSPVIVECLVGSASLVPPRGNARWRVLRLQALSDALMESIIRVWLENNRSDGERRQEQVEWETERIDRGLEALEDEPRALPYFDSELTIADISVGVMLEYLDLRLQKPWRAQAPRLAEWLTPISARKSFLDSALGHLP